MSNAPPAPAPSSMSGQVPSSGAHPSMRHMNGLDPRGPGQMGGPQMGGPQGQMANPSSGVHFSTRNPNQGDPRLSSQPPQAGMAPQAPHPSSRPPPVQLSTMRLPDEQTVVPGSQDKTTVYRPKKREPEKKQGLALFIIGAIAFAVVGFGIVYLVQLLVRAAAH